MQSLPISYIEKLEAVVQSRKIRNPVVLELSLELSQSALKVKLLSGLVVLLSSGADRASEVKALDYAETLWAQDQVLVGEMCEGAVDQGVAKAYALFEMIRDTSDGDPAFTRKQLVGIFAAIATALSAVFFGGNELIAVIPDLMQKAGQR